jgi:PhnB protein
MVAGFTIGSGQGHRAGAVHGGIARLGSSPRTDRGTLRFRRTNGTEPHRCARRNLSTLEAARLDAAHSTLSSPSPIKDHQTHHKEEERAMKLQTYLNYGGNCAEAFKFYEKHLGGKIGMIMTHDQAPGGSHVDPKLAKAVLHASITIAGTVLMGADIPGYQPMRSAYMSLSVDSDAEADRIYKVLSEGGEIFMSMQETFFATRFAQFRDKFGSSWMLLHEKPMGPPQP